jgi:hypothetical protein
MTYHVITLLGNQFTCLVLCCRRRLYSIPNREVEASEEEEDDGTVVVQAQPAVVPALPIPVHVSFLMAIPRNSGGPGGRGK